MAKRHVLSLLSLAQLLSLDGSSTISEDELCLELSEGCRLHRGRHKGGQDASSTPPQAPALQLRCMGRVAERALGKKAKTRQCQHKPDFPQKSGEGSLCPLGSCLNSSWACSLQRGSCAVLASSSGEPTGAGLAAFRPSLLPNLPPDGFFQSPPCTKADLCSATHGTEISSWMP